MQVSLRCGSQSHSKRIVGPQQPHHGGRYRQQLNEPDANDVETLICDATGCRSERGPAGDRVETEGAPVGLFFFL
jgi:hypothetical protein